VSTSRELKSRIGSVNSSQKITGAMKMIASARLRKAETALYHTRPYLEELQRMLERVTAQESDYLSPLAAGRDPRRVALVVFGSDDGLCGSFNVMLYKKLLEAANAYAGAESIKVYPVGRKIQAELKKNNSVEVMPLPEALLQKDYATGMLTLADDLIRQYLAGEVDRVEVIYAHFKSIGTQVMTRLPFLPWQGVHAGELPASERDQEYIYEPDQGTLIDMLYPLVLRATLFRALLENQISEQAARILSMQMANDNATKLLKSLQLEYNKLRQQNITAELLDIVGGTIE
jgi:F-type H+-transporting ATPase subunit gamma